MEKPTTRESFKNLSETERFAKFEERFEQVKNELIAEIEKSPDELLPPERKQDYISDLQNSSLDDDGRPIQDQEKRVRREVEFLSNLAINYFALYGYTKDKRGIEKIFDYDLWKKIKEKLLKLGLLVMDPENTICFEHRDQIPFSGSIRDGFVTNVIKAGVKASALSLSFEPGSIYEQAHVSLGTQAEAEKNLEQWKANVEKCKKYKAELLTKKEKSPEPPAPAPEAPLSLEKLMEKINEYRKSDPGQWEVYLRSTYKNRFLRMSAPGIEDMGIMDSYKKVRLEENRSGTFFFIIDNSKEKGYIFPTLWLHFNNTTLTEQLKPFYNLPDNASEGIIEKIEQLAYTEKLADERWEVVKKGKVIFRDETNKPTESLAEKPPEPQTPETPPTIDEVLGQVNNLLDKKEMEKQQEKIAQTNIFDNPKFKTQEEQLLEKIKSQISQYPSQQPSPEKITISIDDIKTPENKTTQEKIQKQIQKTDDELREIQTKGIIKIYESVEYVSPNILKEHFARTKPLSCTTATALNVLEALGLRDNLSEKDILESIKESGKQGINIEKTKEYLRGKGLEKRPLNSVAELLQLLREGGVAVLNTDPFNPAAHSILISGFKANRGNISFFVNDPEYHSGAIEKLQTEQWTLQSLLNSINSFEPILLSGSLYGFTKPPDLDIKIYPKETAPAPEAPPSIVGETLNRANNLLDKKEFDQAKELLEQNSEAMIEQLKTLNKAGEYGKVQELGDAINEAIRLVEEGLTEQQEKPTRQETQARGKIWQIASELIAEIEKTPDYPEKEFDIAYQRRVQQTDRVPEDEFSIIDDPDAHQPLNPALRGLINASVELFKRKDKIKNVWDLFVKKMEELDIYVIQKTGMSYAGKEHYSTEGPVTNALVKEVLQPGFKTSASYKGKASERGPLVLEKAIVITKPRT
ncbi:MAG: hypothetical protein M1127_01695 [Patescibacteria group bacterium]|nr:hypothetical protein [Patescibacteria group bacterium]